MKAFLLKILAKLKPYLIGAAALGGFLIVVALIFGVNRPAEGGAVAALLSLGGAALLGYKGKTKRGTIPKGGSADAIAPRFDAKEEKKHVDAGREKVLDSDPASVVGSLDDATRSGIADAIDSGKRAGLDAAREALHRGGGAGGG